MSGQLRPLWSAAHALWSAVRTPFSTESLETWLATQPPQPNELVERLGPLMCDWADLSATRTQLAAPVVEPAIRDLLTVAARAGTVRGRRLGLWLAGPTVPVLLLTIVIAVA